MSNIDLEALYQQAWENARTGKNRLSAEQLEQVARVLQPDQPPSGEQVTAIWILGYAGASSYRHLLIRFLDGPDDALAWNALRVLWNHWGLVEPYLEKLRLLMRGVSWDGAGNCQEVALGIAEEYLRDHWEPTLFKALLDTCADECENNAYREWACLILGRLLSAGDIPSEELLEKARERLARER